MGPAGKKKKNQKKTGTEGAVTTLADSSDNNVEKVNQAEMFALMRKIQMLEAQPPPTEEGGPEKDYKFWKTQPVPQWNVEGI